MSECDICGDPATLKLAGKQTCPEHEDQLRWEVETLRQSADRQAQFMKYTAPLLFIFAAGLFWVLFI